MKLLIDHWHFQSLATKMVSLLRMGLQGYDTFTHVFLVDKGSALTFLIFFFSKV